MSRIRISSNGIDIAKPGYNVETATPSQMAFSSQMTAMRVILSGYVTANTLYDGRYNVGYVYYPTTYASPPIVMVAGMPVGGASEQTPGSYGAMSLAMTTGYQIPFYFIASYQDRFELFLNTGVVQNSTWKYWVFANQLTT